MVIPQTDFLVGDLETLPPQVAELLAQYVATGKNILICGGTSTGKTTLTNVLTEYIPDQERIVLIEDTAEIQIRKENVLRFEPRREQNGLPAITIRDLLKATLRHRPDRIILGEIRSGEAFDLLQLLNSGHSGTLSTVHANSASQGISRFTTCVLQSGVEMPYRAIKTNIAESLNIIVQIDRRPGTRIISEVLQISGYAAERDTYQFSQVFSRAEHRIRFAGNVQPIRQIRCCRELAAVSPPITWTDSF